MTLTALIVAAMLYPQFISAEPLTAWRPLQLEITAYDDSSGMPPYGYTSNMTKTRHGIAAGPPEIAFGTEIYVPGYGHAEIHDRGCAIQGERLDVWFPTQEEARQYGRQTVLVWVKDVQWPAPAPSKCPSLGF